MVRSFSTASFGSKLMKSVMEVCKTVVNSVHKIILRALKHACIDFILSIKIAYYDVLIE